MGLNQLQQYVLHLSWWQPGFGAELVYIFMIGLTYSFKKFGWYGRHMRRLQTWPASISLYFFYLDWFLRHNAHIKTILMCQIILIVIAIPLWIWWMYINRYWNWYEKTKWFWNRDEQPQQTKKQLANRDKLVQEGHTQDIFSVVPGGKK